MNLMVIETLLSSGHTLQLVQGDIAEETTEAIVNAANRFLQHGAGVAGAIVRRGGPEIQAESNAWVKARGPVPHGSPAWTSGGKLHCRYVIHAVGPIWDEYRDPGSRGEADTALEACIKGSLEVAGELGVQSISIPAISTGIFGFPRQRAAAVILRSIHDYFKANPASGLRTVRIVLYDSPTLAAFKNGWHDIFGA